ncbi:MAG: hypothetical protein Q9181_003035 [Wetmoreana brouardii]
MYASGETGPLKKLARKKLTDPSQYTLHLSEGNGKAAELPFLEVLTRLGPGLYLERLRTTDDNDLATMGGYRIAQFKKAQERPALGNQPPKAINFRRAGRAKEIHLTSALNSEGYAAALSSTYGHLIYGARLEMHLHLTKSERKKEEDVDIVLALNPHLRPEPILKAMPEGTKMMCEPLFEQESGQLMWVLSNDSNWRQSYRATGWKGKEKSKAHQKPHPSVVKILEELPSDFRAQLVPIPVALFSHCLTVIAMQFTDIFSDLLSSLSFTEAHAEAPPAADDDSEDNDDDGGENQNKSEGGEEEGGDDEGGDDGGDDEGGDDEEEEEEEVEDIKPKLEEGTSGVVGCLMVLAYYDAQWLLFHEHPMGLSPNPRYLSGSRLDVIECAKSSQCAPLKHHYDACAERVKQQEEDENHKGPKENCVEESNFISNNKPCPWCQPTPAPPSQSHVLRRSPPSSFFALGGQWLVLSTLPVMRDIPSSIIKSPREEQESLLGRGIEWEEMADRGANNKHSAAMDDEPRHFTDAELVPGADGAPDMQENGRELPVYRVYKRRWFGLMQLVLMNIIVSWDVSPLRNSLPYLVHR